jgi:putative transposase
MEGLTVRSSLSPSAVLSALFAFLASSFRSRTALQIELLALRHQLTVLQQSVKRPRLTATDRWLWAWLSQAWSEWRSALVIAKPETVIGWHRQGFRLLRNSLTRNELIAERSRVLL